MSGHSRIFTGFIMLGRLLKLRRRYISYLRECGVWRGGYADILLRA